MNRYLIRNFILIISIFNLLACSPNTLSDNHKGQTGQERNHTADDIEDNSQNPNNETQNDSNQNNDTENAESSYCFNLSRIMYGESTQSLRDISENLFLLADEGCLASIKNLDSMYDINCHNSTCLVQFKKEGPQ